MNDLLRRMLAMFESVITFSNVRVPATGITMPEEFNIQNEILKGATSRLRKALTERYDGITTRKDGTVIKSGERKTLRKQLLKLSLIAREYPQEFPGEKFRMLKGNVANDDLIAFADQVSGIAKQHKDRFIALGRPADFVERLEGAIKVFRKAAERQRRGKDTRIHANGEAKSAMKEGYEAARRMNAIAESVFEDELVLMNDWRSARHSERPPVRQKPAEQPIRA